MKKYIYSLIASLLLLGTAFSQSAQGQSLQMDIRNQQYSNDTLFFDVYLSRNGGSTDYLLGNGDFVLNYNNSNFSSPAIGYVANSASLTNSNSSATSSYEGNIAAEIGTSNPNTNKIMINVLQPTFSNGTDFATNIAVIDADTNTHRIGTFFITGLQDVTQSPGLSWVTSGSGTKTIVYALNASSPWRSSKINSLIANDPALLAEPSSQPTAFTVTSKSDTAISLSWTRGNGAQVMILAKQASAFGTDFPTDGILYDTSINFTEGSQLGATGVYVVYKSTGTSATIYNLDPSTPYTFAALELNGARGYSENYNITSAATVTDTTTAGEPNTSATDLLITAFGTNTLDLSWTNGDGASRIVVARAGSAVSADPTDGDTYTADADFTAGQDYGSGNIVVYDGSGSSVQVTGLDTGTDYHFAVYEYNGTNGTKNYKIDTPAINNRYTLSPEPVTAATNAVVDSVKTTSFRLAFTNGDGFERLVLVKSGSAVDSLPLDGSVYTGDKAFGNGDSLQTGNFVVYAGNLDSLTITGLTPGTTYYYEVFEFKGSATTTNYLTSSTLTGSATTLEDEPATSATDLLFTAFSTSTLDLSWTNGDGSNRVVVARAGSAVSTDPVDGTTYTADANFSDGDSTAAGQYIVYSGSGSSVQVTGLDTNTQYYFAVYEYNGTTAATNYKIDTPATNQRYTLTTEPVTAATNAVVDSIKTTSFRLSFTAGSGLERLILVKSGSAVDSLPADGQSYTASSVFGSGDSLQTENFVVYASNLDSVTITGLTAGTTYHYEVFEYRGSGEAANYLTSSTLTGSTTTLEDEPATSATDLLFTAFSTSTLDLSWTNGDGSNRVVVARAGSAVSTDPVDGTTYAADANFSDGDSTAAGQYIVYNGSGSSVQVTGLDTNTQYYFAVYEYNGTTAATNYKIDTPATNQRYTLTTEPVTAATNAVVDSIKTTSFRLSFTAGSGLERLILVKSGSAVDSLPADGQSYTASSVFGSGDSLQTENFVVYASNLDSVTITGLTAGTTYHYEVFEYRGSGEAANYLTSSTLTGNATTLEDEPATSATDLLFTAFSTSTLDLSWTNGDGSNRVVVARAGSAVSTVPVDGTTYTPNATFGTGDSTAAGQYIVYNGSGSSVQVTGLDTNTQYYFAVYEYNGTLTATNYKVDTPATNQRYTLSIEPTVAASNGDIHTETTSSLNISFDAGNGTSRMIVVKPTSLITADPADGSAYSASASYGSGDSLTNGEFIVYIGTDTTVSVTGLTPNTTYFYEVFEARGSGESFNYFTSTTLTGSGTTLQDAPTVAASNLVITNVTLDSMSLSWTNGDGANRIVVARKSSAVSGDPADGISYSADASFSIGDTTTANQFVVYNGSSNSVVVTGLSQDTSYYFAVYEYNGSAGSENYLTTTPATGSENTAIELGVFVMLEGPFNGTDMNTDLNTMDSLPSAQPYTAAPWSYTGTQSNSSIPVDIVDWVYVEVRKASSAATANSGTIVAAQAGLLTNDGQLMDSTGLAPMRVKPTSPGTGELYVVVYHRNHIGVMSSTPLTYNTDSSAFVFDFTSGSTQAYGTDAQFLVSGKYVMYSGNADASGTAINADDRSAAWTNRNFYGYSNSDVDLDGIVGASDRSIIYNNTGQDEQIP